MWPAIFLDRDGVIIENRDTYVRSWADVSIYPDALPALAQLNNLTYKIVIVTNQSAVGRGLMGMETALDINRRLSVEIEKAGGRVDGIFMCPHAPEENCSCRKPQPGLIFQAAEALQLNLQQSILIGDALSDIQAGQSAGIPQTILVRTGRGVRQALLLGSISLKPFRIYDSLPQAVAEILRAVSPRL
jgi:D-glycero-D-manno-heptose 1,7-bisphosphate phosphatase